MRLREWDAEKWLCAAFVVCLSFTIVAMGLWFLHMAGLI